MSKVKAASTTNVILKGIVGNKVWSEGTLQYYVGGVADPALFATATTANNRFGTLTDDNFSTEIDASLAAISDVANISFSKSAAAGKNTADLVMFGADGLARPSGSIIEGNFAFPGKAGAAYSLGPNDFRSFGLFNADDANMVAAAEKGGGKYAYWTVIHEILHGQGLQHPHGTGKGSTNTSVTHAELDNEMYTVMSYKGATKGENTYGHAVSPMALDIAALQASYGNNTAKNDGASTYSLTDSATTNFSNAEDAVTIGRAYFAIWDTDGQDEITYSGDHSAMINLNTATLKTTDSAPLTKLINEVKASDIYGMLGELQKGPRKNGADDLKDDFNPKYHAGGFFSRVMEKDGAVYKGVDGGFSIAKGAKIENATGGKNQDVLIGNAQRNTLTGNEGDDYLFGGGGNDDLLGGSGNDRLFGGDGKDRLIGGPGNDTVKGGNGNDALKGRAGDDLLLGNFGNDELEGGGGNDTLNGGAGTDLAVFSEPCRNYEISKAGGTVTITHKFGSQADGTDTLTGIQVAQFSDASIDLTTDKIKCPSIDFIMTEDLSGSFFDDLGLVQAAGPGIFQAVRSVDSDARFGVSSFVDIPEDPYGGPSDYTYRAHLPVTANKAQFVSALNGMSVLNGADFPEAQLIGLKRTAKGDGLGLRDDAQTVIMLSTDAAYHTNSEDPRYPKIGQLKNILENNNAYPIFAVTSGQKPTYEGLVSQLGRGSVVTLTGNSDNISDIVRLALAELDGTLTQRGDDFANTLTGGDGYDGLFGALGNDIINGNKGNDKLDGGGDNDTINGGAGNDNIWGGSGNDSVNGSKGADDIRGNAGSDTLNGGPGRDKIDGGDGSDSITGGTGRDVLIGGKGPDVLIYTSVLDSPSGGGRDLIKGFQSPFDKIDLTGVDANTTLGGNQAFSFIGNAAFSNTAGELRFVKAGVNTIISGDTNSDGTADFQIVLKGLHDLESLDFFL